MKIIFLSHNWEDYRAKYMEDTASSSFSSSFLELDVIIYSASSVLFFADQVIVSG